MYLEYHRRFKDGKEHRYWSIAEKRRVTRGRVADRHILYPGEINDSQRASWLKSIEAFDEHHQEQRRLALFPSHRKIPDHARAFGVLVKLSQFRLHRPWQCGGCWAFCRSSHTPNTYCLHVVDTANLAFRMPSVVASLKGNACEDSQTCISLEHVDQAELKTMNAPARLLVWSCTTRQTWKS
jgi:hypothetical protein